MLAESETDAMLARMESPSTVQEDGKADVEQGLGSMSIELVHTQPVNIDHVQVIDSQSTTTTAKAPSSQRPQPPQSAPPPAGKYDYPPRPLPSYSISKGCPAPLCYKRRIGRFYVFAEAADGRPICMVGPCWPMYLVTFLLIAGGTAAVLGGLARDVIAVCVVGAVLAAITLTALTLTACRNPGIVERRQERLNSEEIYDDRAMTFRPRGAMFEHETGTIIQDIDHFCPWTSTVIAGSNIISFKVFTSTLCVLIVFAIGIVIWGVTRYAPSATSSNNSG